MKKTFTLRIEEETLEKIRKIAEENKRSLNSEIEFLIEKAIKQHNSN